MNDGKFSVYFKFRRKISISSICEWIFAVVLIFLFTISFILLPVFADMCVYVYKSVLFPIGRFFSFFVFCSFDGHVCVWSTNAKRNKHISAPSIHVVSFVILYKDIYIYFLDRNVFIVSLLTDGSVCMHIWVGCVCAFYGRIVLKRIYLSKLWMFVLQTVSLWWLFGRCFDQSHISIWM